MNRAAPILAISLLALAGCTSARMLDPTALTSMQEEVIAAVQPGDTPDAVDPAIANPVLQIAPMVGAPSEAAAPLGDRLSARAQEMGIPLAGAQPGQLVMKGYFSAFSEGSATTVIYVWDVLDGEGRRLHRIQGQEQGSADAGEGWQSVDAAMMQRVADATIDQYAAWLIARAG